ncbi:SusC/RagA family TonB-linked outer membrane protein [Chitinophaga solisilvae]|uniref:TonB-dependent receptor n=1 Tax=Chitinophaga solisilvae TaxID=1233460 RepID=A0A9Q5DAZ8_9BACT|nr:TonB-dependent receptor [Chitinophaga solisilvae]NSL90974.1 TonB-dependent receptor [Chitinophaga solisilvae]
MKKARETIVSRYQGIAKRGGRYFLLTAWLFFACSSILQAGAYSQQLGDVRISLDVRNQPLAKVLSAIEKKTIFRFVYNSVSLQERAAKGITLVAHNKSVEEILREILTPVRLNFGQDGINVLITPAATAAMFISTSPVMAPEPVKGRVISAGGQPLPGVNIKVKGAAQGTITNEKGEFTLQVEPGETLVISYVGFNTVEIPVKGKAHLDITMNEATTSLSQLVVVGYGIQKKTDVTGAIASVKGESLSKMGTTNPIDALQGKVAGLTVSRTGGSPGSMADIRIRGLGTMGNHQPLFIIDGVPGDPYFLNNDDITSMEVLKDAAAAAIYGSRAANGVILITTKTGKKGNASFDFSMFSGTVTPTKRYEFLDADGYRKVHRQMYVNAGRTSFPAYLNDNAGPGWNTNWQDEIGQKGNSRNYTMGIRGGGDVVTFSLSGSLTDEAGTIIGSDFNKKALRSRVDVKKGIFDVDVNIYYANTRRELSKINLKDAYYQSPLLPVFDPSEKYGYALEKDGLPKFQNPVAADNFYDSYNRTQYFVSNGRIAIDLAKGLKYTVNLGYTSSHEFDYSYYPPNKVNGNDPEVLYPYVYNQRSNWEEKLMENLLTWNQAYGKHNISLLGGYTASSQTYDYLNASVIGKSVVRYIDENGNIAEKDVPGGFLDPRFNTLKAGLGGTYGADGSGYVYNRTSLLGRINYSYADKYLVQFTVRRDGSSKFGPDSRYGTFPSIALGWRITEEPFMKSVDWLSNLKLRLSKGKLGNEVVLGNYDAQPRISMGNYSGEGYVQGTGATPWPGSIARDLENRRLRWETVNSSNIGVDFGFLNNALSGSINYFNNRTTDLLVVKRMPSSAGINDPILNVGEIANKGIELELNYTNSYKGLTYDVTGTFSTLKNEVLSLANNGQILQGAGLKFGDHIPTQTRVGSEIGAFYLYRTDGIFRTAAEVTEWNKAHNNIQPKAKPGDVRFIDTNGDGKLDPNDKVYAGTGMPKYEYSLNINLGYKNFDLTIFLQGAGGNKIYNGNRFEMEGMEAGRNFLTTTLNAWTPENINSTMPRAILGDPNGNNRESDRFLENGDYLRLKTLQLGYTVPLSLLNRIHCNRLRIYASGQNLLTFTKYSGLDPEVGRTGISSIGVDRVLYPQTKTIMAGVQLSF